MTLRIVVLITAWLLLHGWLAHRLLPRDAAPRWRRAGWAGALLLGVLPILAMVSLRTMQGTLADALQTIGFATMGCSALLLVYVVARDAWLLTLWLARRPRAWMGAGQPADPEARTRRAFLLGMVDAGAVAATLPLSVVGGVQALAPAVVRVRVPIAGLHPDLAGLRIAQISDLHVGPSIDRSYVSRVVASVNALDADLVVATGDLVDGRVAQLADAVAPLAGLRARSGVFCVTGNHEYYWQGDEWVAEFRRLGLEVLLNQHRVLTRGAARLLVAGVADLQARRFIPAHGSDAARAVHGAPDCALRLLLAHQPRSIFAAEDQAFDLQLSGHTHGGQFFPLSLLIHLVQPYVAGLYRHRDGWLYVNRGTGYWGPPNRLGNRAEITLLELVAA